MLALVIAGAILAEPPLIPAFFTADRLDTMCRRPDDGNCLMYVAGAMDGIFYVRFNERPVLLCPTAMTNRQVAVLFMEYLDKNPEDRKLAAAAAVRRAVASKIECETGSDN